MTSNPRLPALVLLGLGLLLTPSSNAVMPPAAEAHAALSRIERMAALRAQAPEHVKLHIQSASAQRVEGDFCPAVETWTVEAIVISRSRGSIEPGQALRLHYEVEHYRCPGPVREHWPALQSGTELDALLHCNAGRCEPAAGPMSFMTDAAFAEEHARRAEEVKRYAPQQ